MEKKKFNKKTLFIILGVLLLGVLTVLGTYAYFAWSSTGDDKDATIAVSSVNGLGQCNKATDNQKILWPVSSRNNGRIVTVNAKQTLSEYAYIIWTLTIDSINTQETETAGLKHQSFKYELVNTTTGVSYGSGNFENLDVGDTITFEDDELLDYNTDYTFTLYLWIDGTIGRNPMDMTNQTYQFSLACDIVGASEINNLSVIDRALITGTNKQYFLDESLLKNTIESFDITTDSIPTGVTPIDISKDHNGKVLLWYQDSDGNGLNEVHIKSETVSVFIPGITLAYMFADLTNATSIDLTNMNATYITNIDGMFSGCSNLVTLNFDKFNFGRVESYNNIFDSVPVSVDMTVNDCAHLLDFERKIGYDYSNLHTSDNIKSCYKETKTSDTYILDGTIKFDGTNYIDTGINLFSLENINKDFEISLTIQKYITNNISQSTVVNLKDESQTNSWPGAVYRKKNNTTTFEFTARWPGQTTVNIDDTSVFPKTIGFARRNGVLYYFFNDSGELKLINTPSASLTKTFTSNLTFGASTNNGTPFRFFTGIVSNINVHLY